MLNSEITEAATADTTPETENPKPAKKPRAPRKPKAAKPKASGKTLADLCEAYVAYLEEAGKSPGTIFSYTAELKLACSALGRDTLITALTPEDVERYYTSDRVTKLRSGAPKANASVAKTRRVLRLALCYALEQGWIEKVPLPESDASH